MNLGVPGWRNRKVTLLQPFFCDLSSAPGAGSRPPDAATQGDHQPYSARRHRSSMPIKVSPVVAPVLLSLGLSLLIVAFTGCAPNQTPDQIRQQTAQATEDVKRDTKA